MTSSERDKTDMDQLVAGDESALENLMKRYGRGLFRFTYQILKDRTETADAVEEAFVRVYQNRQRFEFRCIFSTWLFAIARNLALDRLRKRVRLPKFVPLEFNDETENDESDGYPGELIDSPPLPSQEWEEAIADLPEKLPVPLLHFTLDGCSQAEIANLFHCTVKTIELCLYHARKRLRTRLAGRFKIS